MLMDFGEWSPTVESPVFLAPGSYVIGRAVLREEASVWFNAVIRADSDVIELGPRSNLQDNSVLHADRGIPCLIGSQVTIGHGTIIHGAQVDDRVLVGMGSVVMNGAHLHSDVIVGAGTLITEGTEIPPGTLVLGRPGRVVRDLKPEELQRIQWSAAHYVDLWKNQGWHFH
ncbi:gamma carbonic anhydrase family protein [Sulfobacillus harzensis]|uniref:Gamma carbonic anhydrase family protein n=1 Tax=Sulfobacillus harzensis TaxID=2729629 RepID=A0A7Y0L8E4_9FIRM|nr:gamma carbonic anhydrase family protein [Sulfobacillus harzensis]NMP24701.1 gamma carbonic anhydrase family protein [Sulfobacillus harzensis]